MTLGMGLTKYSRDWALPRRYPVGIESRILWQGIGLIEEGKWYLGHDSWGGHLGSLVKNETSSEEKLVSCVGIREYRSYVFVYRLLSNTKNQGRGKKQE